MTALVQRMTARLIERIKLEDVWLYFDRIDADLEAKGMNRGQARMVVYIYSLLDPKMTKSTTDKSSRSAKSTSLPTPPPSPDGHESLDVCPNGSTYSQEICPEDRRTGQDKVRNDVNC